MTFAEKIKFYRTEAGLTQYKVSQLLGIKRSTYAYYELGKSVPKHSVLKKLAAMYKMSIDELLDAKPDNNVFELAQEDESDDWESFDSFLQLSSFEKMLVMKSRMMDVEQLEELKEYIENTDKNITTG